MATLCNYTTNVTNLGSCDNVTLTDNGNGTYTFSGSNTLTFPADPVISGTFSDATGLLTLELNSGQTIDIDISDCCDNIGAGGFTSTMTQVVTTGQAIATHNDGNGVDTDILETVTTLVNNNDGTYTYTSEDATETIIIPTSQKYTEIIPTGTSTIDVPHNLNTVNVVFQMIDLTTNTVVFPDTKITLTANTTRFTFSPATTGQVQVILS